MLYRFYISKLRSLCCPLSFIIHYSHYLQFCLLFDNSVAIFGFDIRVIIRYHCRRLQKLFKIVSFLSFSLNKIRYFGGRLSRFCDILRVFALSSSDLRRVFRIRVELSAGVIRDCLLMAVATVRARKQRQHRAGYGGPSLLSYIPESLGPRPDLRERVDPAGGDPAAHPSVRFVFSVSFSFSLSFSYHDQARGVVMSKLRGVPTCREG